MSSHRQHHARSGGQLCHQALNLVNSEGGEFSPSFVAAAVNSAAAEARPWLSSDGKRLYLGSNRAGHVGEAPNSDLYMATRR